MYKIFPFATMLSATLWLMVLGLSLMDLFTQWTSLPPAARYAVVAVNGLLLFVTWKPIWQRLWSFSTRFHSWFPDLNGNYDVELRVNWPIQSALLKAAAGNSAFDPLDKDAKLPKLKTVKLKAKLDVGFFGVDARLWSTDDRDGAGVIDQSRWVPWRDISSSPAAWFPPLAKALQRRLSARFCRRVATRSAEANSTPI
jgi:hypothetical protein